MHTSDTCHMEPHQKMHYSSLLEAIFIVLLQYSSHSFSHKEADTGPTSSKPSHDFTYGYSNLEEWKYDNLSGKEVQNYIHFISSAE